MSHNVILSSDRKLLDTSIILGVVDELRDKLEYNNEEWNGGYFIGMNPVRLSQALTEYIRTGETKDICLMCFRWLQNCRCETENFVAGDFQSNIQIKELPTGGKFNCATDDETYMKTDKCNTIWTNDTIEWVCVNLSTGELTTFNENIGVKKL